MTSFATHRRRVLDTALPAFRRHSALRTCLTEFAPYGLRATYHHLTLSAAIPRDLDADPASLVRAVEELHEARQLYLADAAHWIVRRKAEKRAGRRIPEPGEPWWEQPLPWADPLTHPSLSLPDYVRRRIALAHGAVPDGCRYCGDRRPSEARSTGHGFEERCQGCGARVPCPCGARHGDAAGEAVRSDETWRRVWRRDHRQSG